MISICTVILDRLQSFLDINIESICEQLEHVKEVIICNVEQDSSYNREEIIKGKTFKYFGGKQNLFQVSGANSICEQHALGLHMAIERATHEFIWLSDPDIFFYNAVDKIFLDLIGQYKLNCIGISHQNAMNEAYGFFPTVANLMVRKKDLPDNTYLKKELTLNFETPNKYLFPGRANIEDEFYYNPKGHFETGCNLLPWAIKQNWRWLSFQTLDCSNYSTLPYRNQPRSNIKLPKQKLLHHSGLSAGPHNKIVPFLNAYKNFKKDEL
jgi:hypothetical protein